jgi:hypothetical protein
LNNWATKLMFNFLFPERGQGRGQERDREVKREREVKRRCTRADILWLQKDLCSNGDSIADDMLGSLCWVSLSAKGTFLRIQLIQEDRVALRILEEQSETDTDTTNEQWTHLQVIAKVVDSSAGSRSSEMVIEPSEEDILRRKLQKTRHVFTLLQQDDQLRMVLERNLGEKLDLDNLPQEAEDEDGTASA